MRIVNDIIASIARGVLGAVPEMGDDTLKIGAALSPIVRLSKPIIPATTFVQRDSSFNIVFAAQSRNQAGATTTGPVFAKGMWNLQLHMMVLANWDNSASNTPQAVLNLASPVQNSSIASFHTGLASFVHLVSTMAVDVLIPDDGYLLSWTLATTGVGQTTIAEVGVIANKLL